MYTIIGLDNLTPDWKSSLSCNILLYYITSIEGIRLSNLRRNTSMSKQIKSYRKFITTSVATAVVATVVAPTISAAESFTDVEQGSWYAENVAFGASEGIFNGYPEGDFRPEATMTRAEAVTAILKAKNVEIPDSVLTTSYPDVAADKWFAAAIETASDLGIVGGMPSGDFEPNVNLTRAEFSVMVMNAFDLEAGDNATSDFSDVKEDLWYATSVEVLSSLGIVQGNPDGTFAPGADVKRNEAAAFVHRTLDPTQRIGYEEELTIESVSAVNNITINEDEEVVLPETVEVTYNDESTEDVAVSWNTDAFDLSVPGTYDLTGTIEGTDLTASVNVVVEAVLPKVSEVSAINANEILVTFNKELNKASAETIANYSIDAVTLKGTDSVALQADKKSVKITLATDGSGVLTTGLLANNTAYEIKADKALILANGDTLAEDSSKSLVFSDKVAPSLRTVSTEENGDVTVSFSERLDESVTPNIVINEVAVSAANITVNADGTVTVDATDAAVSALTNGDSYTVVVEGATDLIANKMGLSSTTFVYNVLNEEPTLVSATADGETTIELTFDEAVSALNNGTEVKVYKDGNLVTATPTTTDGGETYSLDFAYGDIYATGETTVNLSVVLEGYKDTQSNIGNKVTETVTLQKDTTKPTITKAEYDPATNDVTLTFSEDLAAETEANFTSKMFVADTNGVKYDVVTSVSATADTALVATGDFAGSDDTITFDASKFSNGTYYLTVQSGAFTDTANTVNSIGTQTVSFTVGNSSDTGVPTVDSATQVSKGQFTVNFSEAVKGGDVTGSATSLANYKINGSVLPAGTTIYLNQTKDVATITLPEGAIATSGVKLLTVNNVQDLAGNAIAETTKTISLTENTQPELVSAKVVSGELLLTFSENVSTAQNLDFSDFLVEVNGVDVTEASGTITTENNQFAISVSDANLATGTISVSVSDTADATDAANNAIVSGTTVTATR